MAFGVFAAADALEEVDEACGGARCWPPVKEDRGLDRPRLLLLKLRPLLLLLKGRDERLLL